MSELFAALAVLGDPVKEEDRVVHLLASLQDSFDMLVTALEAQSESVPKWELVTERLLHKESKFQEKAPKRTDSDGRKALTASNLKRPKSFKCHFCDKPGHFKKDCMKFLATQSQKKQAASLAETYSDEEALVTT